MSEVQQKTILQKKKEKKFKKWQEKKKAMMGKGNDAVKVEVKTEITEDRPKSSVNFSNAEAQSKMKLIAAGYSKEEADNMWKATVVIDDVIEVKTEEKDDDEISDQMASTTLGDPDDEIKAVARDDRQEVREKQKPLDSLRSRVDLDDMIDRTVMNGYCFCFMFCNTQLAVQAAMKMSTALSNGYPEVVLCEVAGCDFLQKVAKSGLAKYIKVNRGGGAYLFGTSNENSRLSLIDASELNIRDVSMIGSSSFSVPQNRDCEIDEDVAEISTDRIGRKRELGKMLGVNQEKPEMGNNVSLNQSENADNFSIFGEASNRAILPSNSQRFRDNEGEAPQNSNFANVSFKKRRM